jgi:glycogen debranching enzyme
VRWDLDADFVDIFELRGTTRKKRGRLFKPVRGPRGVTFAYQGLDRVLRRMRITFRSAPTRFLKGGGIEYAVRLPGRGSARIEFSIDCMVGPESRAPLTYSHALEIRKKIPRRPVCEVRTSNPAFNEWLGRSRSDLELLLTDTGNGLYPFAGIPWFSTVFGRDGLLTAMQTLWFDPGIARGVLTYLAHTQADQCIPSQDAEPGKILHELRKSEMAATGEIPFGRYYGTVDATPLFVMLAGQYFERTFDRALARRLWPNIERALQWIDVYGDVDRDGWVEYHSQAKDGLRNQGWKDSNDSVFHADGRLAESPIALCEVQGYVYAAKLSASRIAEALGHGKRALELRKQAAAFRKKFFRVFWSEKIGSYAMALDGRKKPCLVRSSNAAHCLFTGIAGRSHARRLAGWIMEDPSFNGWGVRTLPSTEIHFNPMSYHNGSVWPHDNALAAYGLSQYGFKKEAARILSGLFDASQFLDLQRLPELFCGFARTKGSEPTLYPVACDPQAWAAGSVFLMLQACLGLSVRGDLNTVYFRDPYLPDFLRQVKIRNLKLRACTLDVTLDRGKRGVVLHISRKKGNARVLRE